MAALEFFQSYSGQGLLGCSAWAPQCRGSSRLQCMGSSLQGLLLVHRLQVHELQEMQHSAAVAPGSRAQAQYLWHMGLAALRNLESSQTRDQTCVPCIG